jgi:hypothetical protein
VAVFWRFSKVFLFLTEMRVLNLIKRWRWSEIQFKIQISAKLNAKEIEFTIAAHKVKPPLVIPFTPHFLKKVSIFNKNSIKSTIYTSSNAIKSTALRTVWNIFCYFYSNPHSTLYHDSIFSTPFSLKSHSKFHQVLIHLGEMMMMMKINLQSKQ